jgi:hypothetical protein
MCMARREVREGYGKLGKSELCSVCKLLIVIEIAQEVEALRRVADG